MTEYSLVIANQRAEIARLTERLAAAEAALAVEKHENTRWETVCDELQAKLAAAEAEIERISKQILSMAGWHDCPPVD